MEAFFDLDVFKDKAMQGHFSGLYEQYCLQVISPGTAFIYVINHLKEGYMVKFQSCKNY